MGSNSFLFSGHPLRSSPRCPLQPRTGHIEKSSLKKQHPKACSLAKIAAFPLYTFRHTASLAGLPTWTRTLWRTSQATATSHVSPVRPSAGTYGLGGNGTRAGSTGWAQFWAQF